MTITITKLGPGSQKLSFPGGTTNAEMLTALDTVLVAQGWAIFDALAGTNAHCYRAPIADGTMGYKYMVLDLNTAGYLLCKVYETWNATTHVGTNLAYNSDATTYAQRVTASAGGLLWVFATPRYAAFFSRTPLLAYGDPTYASFTGCFEISRDNFDEVPGVLPSYAWMNGGLAVGGLCANSQSVIMQCFSLPRTKGGLVGLNASNPQSVGTLIGRTLITNVTNNVRLGGILPVNTNPWSVINNLFVFTPYAIESTSAGSEVGQNVQIRGRFYGLKILSRGLVTAVDTIPIKVDAQGFLDNSITATSVNHMVVNENSFSSRFALPL